MVLHSLLLASFAVLAPAPDSFAGRDLSPLLQGGPAAAGQLLSVGNWEAALSALQGAGQPEARYLRSLAQEATGAYAAALGSLDSLEDRLPDLAGRIYAARGRCLAGLSRHLEAASAFAAVPPGSVTWGDAQIRRARALAGAGKGPQALAVLKPLLDQAAPADPARPDPAAAALALAGDLRAHADPPDADGARSALLRCWADHPVAPEATGCLAGLRDLPGQAGAEPEPEIVVSRAEGLVERNRNIEAISLLEPIARTSPALASSASFSCRVHVALGRALKRDRQNARSAGVLRPVIERCADPSVTTRALFVLATAVSAQGSREEAIGLYLRFAREHPASSLADDALMAAGELLGRAGRGVQATEALQQIIRSHPDGDKFDEARFRLAWQARRDGDMAGALAGLLHIEEDRREVDPFEHARAAYWRAVLLSTQGPDGAAAAAAVWKGLTEATPSDYYALLSRARLAGRPGLEPPGPLPAAREAPWTIDPGPLRANPHFRSGVLLLRLGLKHAADEELRSIDRSQLELGHGAPAPAILLLATLLSRAGNYRDAIQLIRVEGRTALRRPPVGAARAIWALAYPPAFSELVRKHAASSGVPPSLIQALMREESALDPDAVSPAGAIGLTQLMLPTAQEVSRQLKLPRPDRSSLTDPETSIRIGAAYLGQLLRRSRGGVAQALAAYNAGEAAVARWRPGVGDVALDEWIEEIPFEETRGYVKRVLRADAAYRLLSDLPDPE
jgi:soluble lytic murein transglycosylase